jgi:hypothetical protein
MKTSWKIEEIDEEMLKKVKEYYLQKPKQGCT